MDVYNSSRYICMDFGHNFTVHTQAVSTPLQGSKNLILRAQMLTVLGEGHYVSYTLYSIVF
jgi:hypothetical protein